MSTAAALTFAGVLRVATVSLCGGTGALPCAGIILALAFAFAGIDTSADMGITEDVGGVLLGFVVGAGRESGAEDETADSGGCEASEVSSGNGCDLCRGS